MRKFTKPDLPREHERRFWQAIRAGLSVDAAAVTAGASWSWGRRQFVKAGGVNPVAIAEPAGGRHLRFEEREEIMRVSAGSTTGGWLAHRGFGGLNHRRRLNHR